MPARLSREERAASEAAIVKFKASIRKRDGNKCVRCGMTGWAHMRYWGRKLEIHRKQPGGEYSDENCETLCRRCHNKEPKSPSLSYPRGFAMVRVDVELWTVVKMLAALSGKKTKDVVAEALNAHFQSEEGNVAKRMLEMASNRESPPAEADSENIH